MTTLSRTTRTSFTDFEIRSAKAGAKTMAGAAKALTDLSRGDVSPQLLRYWLASMDVTESHDHDRATELVKTRNAMSTNLVLRRDNRALIDALDTRPSVKQAAKPTSARQFCIGTAL